MDKEFKTVEELKEHIKSLIESAVGDYDFYGEESAHRTFIGEMAELVGVDLDELAGETEEEEEEEEE